MNLLQALEKKRALEEVIEEKTTALLQHLDDSKILSTLLNELDALIETYYRVEREIENKYHSTKVSNTESISDVISYVDSIDKKIEVLKFLLLQSHKQEIETGNQTDVSHSTVMSSIKQYEELRHALVKKIKEVCTTTFLAD